MELLQLRYFQAVARYESITKAAEHFGIPQPAMSQSISRLERDLGDVKLFNRQNNRITLNEKGRMFLGHVDVLLAELDDAVKELCSDAGEVSGTIQLLTLENRRFVFKCVSEFSKLYPNINFRLSHEYTEDPSERYDLCVCSSGSFRQMKASLPMIREKLVLNVNEDHPLASRNAVSLGELSGEKFVTMSRRSTLYRITYDLCRAAGFEPNVAFVCDDPYFVRKYVSESMGVAFAPAISWAGRFRANTRTVGITQPGIDLTSYLCWDDKRYMPPAVNLFKEFLMDEARKLEGNEV